MSNERSFPARVVCASTEAEFITRDSGEETIQALLGSMVDFVLDSGDGTDARVQESHDGPGLSSNSWTMDIPLGQRRYTGIGRAEHEVDNSSDDEEESDDETFQGYTLGELDTLGNLMSRISTLLHGSEIESDESNQISEMFVRCATGQEANPQSH